MSRLEPEKPILSLLAIAISRFLPQSLKALYSIALSLILHYFARISVFPRLEAKTKGVRFGRKRAVDRNAVIQLHKQGVGASEIGKKIKVARSSVYRILNESANSNSRNQTKEF